MIVSAISLNLVGKDSATTFLAAISKQSRENAYCAEWQYDSAKSNHTKKSPFVELTKSATEDASIHTLSFLTAICNNCLAFTGSKKDSPDNNMKYECNSKISAHSGNTASASSQIQMALSKFFILSKHRARCRVNEMHSATVMKSVAAGRDNADASSFLADSRSPPSMASWTSSRCTSLAVSTCIVSVNDFGSRYKALVSASMASLWEFILLRHLPNLSHKRGSLLANSRPVRMTE